MNGKGGKSDMACDCSPSSPSVRRDRVMNFSESEGVEPSFAEVSLLDGKGDRDGGGIYTLYSLICACRVRV